MCGKPNPADAEVCQFCGARLRPIRPGEEPKPEDSLTTQPISDEWDLLQGGQSEGHPQAEEKAAETPQAAEEDLPDWMKELGGEAEDEEEEELPDWLSELGLDELGAAEEPSTAEAEPKPAAAAPAEELPDWLDELGAAEEPSTTEAEPEPAAAAPAEELPDWLDELGGETEEDLLTALGQPEESETADEALPEGELPAWVEAMRPVEISPEELGINEPVESTGPLAGLRGVIPPAPPATTPKQKIGVTSSRLTLSEEEEKRLKAITELLQEEFSPKKLPKKRKKVGGRILHRLFGLVLLVVAFLPLLLPSLQAPLPNKALPSALAAKRLIDKVPPKGVVLVGVDYNLGFSAELEAAATPALAQLIGKGVRLVAISTNPVGGGMAERLIENASAGKTYREGTDYLNLGYLPGGTAALYAFARSPRAVLPSVLRYKNVWNSAILQKIKTANDFDLVLVITEDPDTARSWIEQVQPALKTTPLVMVISAQAEPLVAPYYETARHQVGGIITGLESGVAYREMAGQSATQKERGIWSSYSLITLTVVVLMALGGLYAWILGLIDRKHRSAEVEE